MKKTLIYILILFIYFKCYPQFDSTFKTEYESFQSISKSNPNSELSNYLKKHINTKDLRRVNFSSKETTVEKTIRLTFQISKKNTPRNFRIRTGDRILDDKIKKLFKDFPLEKLGLKKQNRLGKCSVQLFSKHKGKTIINASSIAILDIPPILKDCQHVKYYSNLTSCFYQGLYKHIIDHFSSVFFMNKKLKKPKELKIYPRFSVDLMGDIYNINESDFKFKNYKNNLEYVRNSKNIESELYRVIKLFNQIIKPATRNGSPIYFNYDTQYIIIVERNTPKKI